MAVFRSPRMKTLGLRESTHIEKKPYIRNENPHTERKSILMVWIIGREVIPATPYHLGNDARVWFMGRVTHPWPIDDMWIARDTELSNSSQSWLNFFSFCFVTWVLLVWLVSFFRWLDLFWVMASDSVFMEHALMHYTYINLHYTYINFGAYDSGVHHTPFLLGHWTCRFTYFSTERVKHDLFSAVVKL